MYTSSYDLARSCVFSKQSLGPGFCIAPSGFWTLCPYTLPGRSFSRSYGSILPSSLTRVISLALVFSTCPPVSVWGTGTPCTLARELFSAAWAFSGFTCVFSKRLGIAPLVLRSYVRSGFTWAPSPYTLTPGQPTPGSTYPSASLHCWPSTMAGSVGPEGLSLANHGFGLDASAWWYWNINQLSIDYASRPRLRSRLTLGGRAFPRKPWTFGGGDSHSTFATHAGILTRAASTAGFRRRFTACSTLPYRSHPLDAFTTPKARAWPKLMMESRSFGGVLEPRYIFRAGSLDQ